MTPSCPFCDKLAELDRVADNDDNFEVVRHFANSVAFLGPWQYYHGYCILVARRHAGELSQLPPFVRHGFFNEMCKLAKAIETCFKPHKLNYELLGNQMPHLHWHIFPRRADDPDSLKPVWLALERAERDEQVRLRLQTGPISRAETIALLQEYEWIG